MTSVEQPPPGRRFSVVFLTYNASMSDSLESIYRAFKANPQADVHWIPIPYYERRPDGSAGELRFEGPEDYPDWIECTDWREYDIAQQRPDAIFTFAPYDGNNRVTAVHPDYYCERLHKLTGLLVYVPYFVAVDHVPEHFCLQPGTAHADLVVLQSARIRDTYRTVFAKEFKKRYGDVDEKFVALGSPKFDKALETIRRPEDVPPELIAEIGSRTVVLLNTTVSGLLGGGREWVRKLLSVMVAFSGRDDTFVWWRPHPLIDATIASMRPELREMYAEVQQVFTRHVAGLYDDSPDVHRAIAWSDAYYGDWSSLIALYTATGKPVMLGNPELLSEELRAAGGRPEASETARPHAGFVRPPYTMHGPMDAIYHELPEADIVDYLDFLTDPATASDEAVAAMRQRRLQIFTENTTHAEGTAGVAIASYVRWLLLKQGIA